MTAIKDAVARFREVQETYAEFGACDTEPRSVFAGLLIDTYNYKEVTLPRTARDWQLFTGEGMKGNGLAAAALTRSAARVLRIANEDRFGLARYLEAEGWC